MVDGWNGLTQQPSLPLLLASLWSSLWQAPRQGACSQQCRTKAPSKLLFLLMVRALAPVSPLNLVCGASPGLPLNPVPLASPLVPFAPCPLPHLLMFLLPFPECLPTCLLNFFFCLHISLCPHSVLLFVSPIPFHPCLASSYTHNYILIIYIAILHGQQPKTQ